jgi:predicted peptidase
MINPKGVCYAVLVLVAAVAGSARGVIPGGVFAAADQLKVIFDPRAWPQTVGYHSMAGTAIYHGRKMPFYTGIFLPRAFFQTTNPMPIVMTLHNRASIGGNGTGSTVGEGMGRLLAQGERDGRAEGDTPDNPISLREEAQFIGLVPQCPAGFGWEDPVMSDALCQIIDLALQQYHADADRVYLTGFSYGASSTWRVALNYPDRFAAIVCCDGRATPDPVNDVKKLKDLPIYLEVGEWDGEFVAEADRMHAALDTLPHRNYIFRQIPGGNHFNYGAVYTDPAVWKWVLAQHRPHAVATTQASAADTSAAAR